MKRPEYTGIVTQVYSKAVHQGLAPTDKELERLEMAFSREGFTDGYFTGDKSDMHGVRTEPDKEVNKLYAQARREYSGTEMRRVPVDFFAVVQPEHPASLLVRDADGNRASVEGPYPERAQKSELTEKSLHEQLYKTGGTPYLCRDVNISLAPGQFLPAAAINDLRRRCLQELTAKRLERPARPDGKKPVRPVSAAEHNRPVLNIQVLTAQQLTPELAELRPETLYVPLTVLHESFDSVQCFIQRGTTVCAVLPRIITDTECGQVIDMLKAVGERGIDQALAGNLGHIALARQCGYQVRGDFGLNVFNSYTLETLKEAGLLSATASFELRMAQVRDLIKSVDTELIVYGRLPCMVTDQCIIKKSSGSCTCQQGSAGISDRMGSVFPVVKEFGCRNVIYNAHKLFLADKSEDIVSAGLWGARLLFTTESPRECVLVTKSYMGQSEYSPNGLTRGLYYRGVE
jgi:putative protease